MEKIKPIESIQPKVDENSIRKTYQSMTNPILIQLCRDRKIKGFSGKKKELLIEMLLK
jgi:hypothetical protein